MNFFLFFDKVMRHVPVVAGAISVFGHVLRGRPLAAVHAGRRDIVVALGTRRSDVVESLVRLVRRRGREALTGRRCCGVSSWEIAREK